MNNKERLLKVLAALGLAAIAFGAVYSVIWMIFTKAAWIPVAADICVVAAAVPTAVRLWNYIKA